MNRRGIEMIHKEGNINKVDCNGRTPLWYAVFRGQVDIIQQLLEYKCDVNMPDNAGISPLLIAIDNGNYNIVSILLEYNCAIRDRDVKQAMLKGEVYITQMILDTGKCSIRDVVYEHQHTCLHIAAIKGYDELIHPLIHAGCDVNKRDSVGRTALICAVEHGHYAVVVEFINIPPSICSVPVDINATFESGKTALFVAVKRADTPIVTVLLTQTECDTNISWNGECPPLRMAVYNQNADIVQLLLQRDDCKVEFDPPGPSILCLAVNVKNLQIASMILNTGLCTDVGLAPFCFAIEENNVQMVSLLLQYGAKDYCNMQDYWNSKARPLCIAAVRGYTEICVLLLHYRFDVNTPDINNHTPLYLACCYQHEHTVSALLTHGHNIDVNVGDNRRRTAIWIASSNGNINIVNMLISSHCDLNIPTTDSKTALRAAIHYNHMQVARELWAHGGRLNKDDKNVPFSENVRTDKFIRSMTQADIVRRNMQLDEYYT